ncbi:hypothetical protein OHT76_42230 [Streptomyces sp. NBC_00287]|nr:hypothetical protein [Streptomyces sp. NBC_00287]
MVPPGECAHRPLGAPVTTAVRADRVAVRVDLGEGIGHVRGRDRLYE